MQECDVRQATHVKTPSGEVKKIRSTWGIDENGRLAKPSEGGFGVITQDGEQVGMMEARLYYREN